MNALLEERRKQLKHKVKGEVEHRTARARQPEVRTDESNDLKKLVESVKRKTGGEGQRPEGRKRRRV